MCGNNTKQKPKHQKNIKTKKTQKIYYLLKKLIFIFIKLSKNGSIH